MKKNKKKNKNKTMIVRKDILDAHIMYMRTLIRQGESMNELLSALNLFASHITREGFLQTEYRKMYEQER